MIKSNEIKWSNDDDDPHQAEKLKKIKSNDDDNDDDLHQAEKLMWRDKAFSSWTPPL